MDSCFYALDVDDSSVLVKVCPITKNLIIESGTTSSVFDQYAIAQDMDYLWVLLAGALVFFMQTGFTLLEAGMVKHTNVQSILFKNMMDACIGTISFFLFGYCLAFGDDDKSNGFLGFYGKEAPQEISLNRQLCVNNQYNVRKHKDEFL